MSIRIETWARLGLKPESVGLIFHSLLVLFSNFSKIYFITIGKGFIGSSYHHLTQFIRNNF